MLESESEIWAKFYNLGPRSRLELDIQAIETRTCTESVEVHIEQWYLHGDARLEQRTRPAGREEGRNLALTVEVSPREETCA